MKAIIRDFLKAHIALLMRYVVVVALCVVGFGLTGIFERSNTRMAGIVVTAFLCAILVWAFVDVLLVAPAKFKARMSGLSEEEQKLVTEGYPDAAKLGKRFFYKSGWLMLYSYRRIQLVRLGDIRSADLKGTNIFLTLSGESTVLMPIEPKENDAMLLAVLKQHNSDINFFINGRPVSAECGKAAEGKDDS